MVSVDSSYPGEAEIYVPMFIFPEEVVAYDGRDCQFTPMDQRDGSPACAGLDERFAAIPFKPTTPIQNAYFRPLFGFATDLEIKVVLAAGSERTIVTDEQVEQHAKFRDIFYDAVATSRNAHEFRVAVAQLDQRMKPSCAVLQSLLDSYEASNEPDAAAAAVRDMQATCPGLHAQPPVPAGGDGG
jgi:hypothetical protein